MATRDGYATRYDVIIVGAGPAGIFAALELSQTGLRVLMLEKGNDLEQRVCPMDQGAATCISCRPCSRVSGFGGAGAFSDGKLTLTPDVGGRLGELLDASIFEDLISYVDSTYVRFGAPDRVYGEGVGVADLQRRAIVAGLRLVPVKLRHLGCENCMRVLESMRAHLDALIDIRTGDGVKEILVDGDEVTGVRTEAGERLGCGFLVCAPGREGAEWLENVARTNGLKLSANPVDVGCRVELPAPVMDELSSILYEAKLEYYSSSFDDRIRTFCMCPHGEVIMESTGGDDPVVTVNGVGYAERQTANTNFAVLVSTTFTEPFREPIAYGKYLARLANLVSGGVLVQRLGDLKQGRRSTVDRLRRSLVEPTLSRATPGDLSFVLPYRYLTDIVEMLEALDRLAPGVASPHTLLYGVEVKFYSSQLELTSSFETRVNGLFAVGDGAGVSRGLVQASASGVVAGRAIAARI
ncbi:MAG: NAD(P)/FAD-dependent oxidoreductase [Chloroflexota bacterium]